MTPADAKANAVAALAEGASLTDALIGGGFTHRARANGNHGGREIVDATGAVVFAGTYDMVVDWLGRKPSEGNG